jgi:[acyl-carrier-protein] S-malonyltransferase
VEKLNKIAFLFPGQGAQKVGMGKDIYEEFDVAKGVYDRASEILGIDIADLCFNSTEEELNKTENTQIAILVTSLATLEVLKEKGITAEITAGLSLGEYTSLIYSGRVSFEDGIKLVRKRGECMRKAKAIRRLENGGSTRARK